MALRKSLSTAGRAVSDAQMKDILKNARNGLSDKALPIQRAAADVRIIPPLLLTMLTCETDPDCTVPYRRWQSFSR